MAGSDGGVWQASRPARGSALLATSTTIDVAARRRWLVVAGDTAAVLLLLAATVYLAGHDGGRPLVPSARVVMLGLVALPALAGELRRLTPRMHLLLAALALGPLVATVLAPIRAGIARPLLAAAIAPLVFLAARRVWRRSWGPWALTAVLGLALGRAWYQAMLAWWGSADGGGAPQWLALSWHNQSGTLMGAGGVGALALALTLKGRAGAFAAVGAVPLLAGAWLSGSRGAVIAVVVGMLLVLAAALRRRPARAVAGATLTVLVLTVGAVAGLTSMTVEGGQPVAERDQDAAGNFRARIGHAEAAGRMFLSRPLTGYGPGSYRWASVAHYPEDTNLTASAHMEYLEAFGEGGIAWGLPVLLAALGVAWLGLAVLRGPPAPAAGTPPPAQRGASAATREAGQVAALGAAAVLGVHAAVDFDWDYPLLVALLAVAAAVLHAQHVPARPPSDLGEPAGGSGRWSATGATVAALGLLAVAAVLAVGPVLAGVSAPWSLEARLAGAVEAMADDDLDRAEEELATAARWNPGSPALPVLDALLAYERGERSAEEVVAVIDPRGTAVRDQLLVAGRLVDAGEPAVVEDLLGRLRPVIDDRTRWGSTGPAAGLARWSVEATAEAQDCDAAQRRLDELADWLRDHRADPAEVAAEVERCRLTPP
jgi:O-antigen ligase